jgi:hypothetical protein
MPRSARSIRARRSSAVFSALGAYFWTITRLQPSGGRVVVTTTRTRPRGCDNHAVRPRTHTPHPKLPPRRQRAARHPVRAILDDHPLTSQETHRPRPSPAEGAGCATHPRRWGTFTPTVPFPQAVTVPEIYPRALSRPLIFGEAHSLRVNQCCRSDIWDLPGNPRTVRRRTRKVQG